MHSNVIHYGVQNISARYSRISLTALGNLFTPYILKISEYGGLDVFLGFNFDLKYGTYIYKGIVTNSFMSEQIDISSKDINLLLLSL
jgi:alanine dehydrogenase